MMEAAIIIPFNYNLMRCFIHIQYHIVYITIKFALSLSQFHVFWEKLMNLSDLNLTDRILYSNQGGYRYKQFKTF